MEILEEKDYKNTLKENFRNKLMKYITLFNKSISDEKGDWVVKGFIDIAKNIYTISIDTKIVSKIMEIILFPKICQFAEENDYKMILCKEQNFYPDISFIDKDNNKFAIDIKAPIEKTKKK